MNDVRRYGIRNRWLGLVAVGALLLSGCAGALTGDEDVRVIATGEGLYLFTRSPAMARSMCIAAGLDAARAEGRLFAEGRRFSMNDNFFASGTQGCQMQPRSLVICQEGDARCAIAESSPAPKPQGRNK
jgi:outer membrane murein-binding lipoprotein Lpp